MRFTAHGKFDISVEFPTLIVDATGPFNEELVTRYEAALKKAISTLSGSYWDQIIVLHGLSLFTPQAEKDLTRTIIERKAVGLHRSAVVIDTTEGTSMIKIQMSRCYDNADIEHAYFDNIEDAKNWLSGSHSASA